MIAAPDLRLANRQHRLYPDHWWLCLPQHFGGRQVYDIGKASGLCHGTLTNMGAGSGWGRATRPGGWGQLIYDGANDNVACTSAATVQPTAAGTISIWAFPVGASTSVMLSWGSAGSGLNGVTLLATTNVNWRTYVGSGAAYQEVVSATAMSASVWNHLVETWDGANVKLFLNGKQTASAAQTITPTSGVNQTRIGSDGALSGRYFTGSLDDAALYSRALSAAEVFALYNESRLGYPTLLPRLRMPLGGASALFRRNLMLRVGSRGAYV